MIDVFLFLFRFLSDFFWQYKIVTSVTASCLVVLLFFITIAEFKRRQSCYFYKHEIVISIFILFIIFSFLYNFNELNVILFFKLTASVLCFYLGSWIPKVNTGQIYIYYLPIFLLVCISFVSGNGFIYWGAVRTFTGGYFFKTDLALALSIFLIFVLVSPLQSYFKLVFLAVSSVFVFYSNSRIFYLIFILIMFAYYYRSYIVQNAKKIVKLSVLSFIFSIVCIQIVFLVLSKITLGTEMLSFDLSEGFTGGNTQGRNVIWENLLDHFFSSNALEKLLGAGLDADIRYSQTIGFFDQVNAHNTFLYLLVAVGALGLCLFLYILYIFLQRYIVLASNIDIQADEDENLFCFLGFSIIFLVSSITTTTLVFQQVSWFFFFYSGILFNKNIYPVPITR